MEHSKFVSYYESYFGRWPVDPDNPEAGDVWNRVIRDTPEFEAEKVFDAVAAAKRGMRNPRVSDFKAVLANLIPVRREEGAPRAECGLCRDTGWMVVLFWRATGDRVWHFGSIAPGQGETRRGTVPCLCSAGYRAEPETVCPRERRETARAWLIDFRRECAQVPASENEYMDFLKTKPSPPEWARKAAETALAHREAVHSGTAAPLVCKPHVCERKA